MQEGYTKNNGRVVVNEKEWESYGENCLNELGIELNLSGRIVSLTMHGYTTKFIPEITLTGKPIMNDKGAYEYPYKCGNYVGKALLCPDESRGGLLFSFVSEIKSGIEKRFFIYKKK